MLDSKDLQAIAELIAASEQRMDARMDAMEERMSDRLREEILASEERMTAKIDDRIRISEERMKVYIEDAKKDAIHQGIVYSEGQLEPKIEAFYEWGRFLVEERKKVVPENRVEKIETDVFALKSVVSRHSHDIADLKKAQ